MMYIKTEENGFKSFFNKAIDQYNKKLRNHSDFMVPFGGNKSHYLYNSTIAYAPILDAES